MGKWTPLILMAGGLAILLGTLLGINFPMGGGNQTANAPTGKAARVLPANINVNGNGGNRNDDGVAEKTQTGRGSTSENTETRPGILAPRTQTERSVAQNSGTNDSTPENTTDTSNTDTQSGNANRNNEPIRALW